MSPDIKITQLYKGRYIAGHKKAINFDVRHFVWAKDTILEDELVSEIFASGVPLSACTQDEIAHRIQTWVKENIKYVSDKTARGYDEFWMMPNETLALRRGDCEDGAFLIASLMLCTGRVEPSRVRVRAGLVKAGEGAATGGHAWVTYRRESDEQEVALDWCYYEDSAKPVEAKTPLKLRSEYIKTWFSFNHESVWWEDPNFEMKGRIHDVIEE